MNFIKPDILGCYYSATIFILALIVLFIRNKRGLFLTGISGLHLTFLLFFGLGSFFYALYGIKTDRIGRDIITSKIDIIFPYLVASYLFLFTIEMYYRKKISNIHRLTFTYLKEKINLNSFNLSILSLSFIGFLFSSNAISTSGAGTIFPVFSNLLLPISILIVFNVNKRDALSIVIFCVLIVLVGVQAFVSAWRSQLILFFGCILIGWSLRGKINYYIVTILAIAFIVFILPFQQIKKSNSGVYDFDTNIAFEQSLDISFAKRLEIAGNFFAERINYTREMGYVQNAIEKNTLSYRNGETYSEVFYQLIPRVIWSSKPVYNRFTGYDVPRMIGILGKSDETSSWGVNSFAEFIYNFSYEYLPLFILALYGILNYLDKLVYKIRLRPEYTWLLQITLFFLSLNLVSVIFSSTYFLWSFIVIILLNAIKGLTSENYSIRRRAH